MIPRKGQAAVEYLMTYGWAILVILAVGVVIWQMGILGFGKDYPPGQRGFSQIKPLDWRLESNGDLTMVLTNDAGTILNLTQVDATVTSGGNGVCTDNLEITDGERMRPAATYSATVSNCPVTEGVGGYYRMNVTIRYLNPSSGLPHVSNGVLWGPIE